MARSERKLKHQFYVWMVCVLVCLSCICYVLQTDASLSENARRFLIVISLVALFCLGGIGYCYISVRRERLHYEKMRRERQEEMNALIDEIQAAHKKD